MKNWLALTLNCGTDDFSSCNGKRSDWERNQQCNNSQLYQRHLIFISKVSTSSTTTSSSMSSITSSMSSANYIQPHSCASASQSVFILQLLLKYIASQISCILSGGTLWQGISWTDSTLTRKAWSTTSVRQKEEKIGRKTDESNDDLRRLFQRCAAIHQKRSRHLAQRNTQDQDCRQRTTNKQRLKTSNQYLLNFYFCNFTSAEYLCYPNWSLTHFLQTRLTKWPAALEWFPVWIQNSSIKKSFIPSTTYTWWRIALSLVKEPHIYY